MLVSGKNTIPHADVQSYHAWCDHLRKHSSPLRSLNLSLWPARTVLVAVIVDLSSMEASRRRLSVVSGHFDVSRDHSHRPSQPRMDLSGLQKLLDHDNHELRQRMKQALNQDLYIP